MCRGVYFGTVISYHGHGNFNVFGNYQHLSQSTVFQLSSKGVQREIGALWFQSETRGAYLEGANSHLFGSFEVM